jgi:hypothetical protein
MTFIARDITRCEAEAGYTYIHIETGQTWQR